MKKYKIKYTECKNIWFNIHGKIKITALLIIKYIIRIDTCKKKKKMMLKLKNKITQKIYKNCSKKKKIIINIFTIKIQLLLFFFIYI